MTTNASVDTAKSEMISTAKSLTDYFNNMYGNLQKLQEDINLEIKQNVDQINSISEKIATLNKQINVIELSGGIANELRDQRELLIDELSEIVDVDTTEYPITDANDPDRETGGHRYIVRIAGGQVLTDGNDYNTLSYVARADNEKVNQTDVNGLYRITWANGNEFNLNNASMDGKLKGLVELRDGNNTANFYGKVTKIEDVADGAGTVQKITVEVTADYLKNMQECTLSDTGGPINVGNIRYYYKSWEFDAATNTYTFTMDESRGKVEASNVGKEAQTEESIKYQGIPYYMEQMNAWIRGFAEKVNDIFTSGVDANGNKGVIFFTGKKSNGQEYTEADFKDSNGYYELTAGNFTVNDQLLKDSSLLGSRSSELVGVEECGKIKEMIELLSSKEKFNFRNGNAGQMLEMLLSDVALNSSNAQTFYKTYKGMQNSIDNQRSSVSGVDKDEEAVSLVKYQNSYTLASKMIQTLTEIYDQLILNTGV